MQFRDLQAQYQKYKDEIDTAMGEVLEEANFIGGRQVGELEQELADYVGVRHCVSCANGTEAMTLVLLAWGIGEGDAVFVPDFSFFATAEVVAFAGARPVFVDVEAGTFNLDPVKLEAAVAAVAAQGRWRPRAVIPVDLFGLPADYRAIGRVAEQYGLWVLEDGAQGFGGTLEGRRALSFGHAATTSFFPAKPLGCYGDGGAVFTDDGELAETVRSLKLHGKGTEKYDNVRIGVNSRLDTLQAAVLQVKLQAFDNHELADVQWVAARYGARLGELVGERVETPLIPEGFTSSFAQYTVKLPDRARRDGLQAALREQGIPSAVYYPRPLHQQGAFAHLGVDGAGLEVTASLCGRVLSLPMHPYLGAADIDRVCRAVAEYLR